MKIASFNVNSIRRRLPIVIEWLERNRPDVLCLQETKVEDTGFPLLELRALGYHVNFRGRKAYNGVATLSLREPEVVQYGFVEGREAEDDRVLLTVIDGVPIVNTYIPQGQAIGSEKYAYKLAFIARLRRYFDERLDPAKPALWLGDLNVAPEPIDVYHPERRVNDPDFHIDARNAFKETRAWGFIDLFRHLHPDRVQYTYWDYFRDSFTKNFGWRIDHILATASLAECCRVCEVDMVPRQTQSASDHTVIYAEFD
jgi:exodeoxyribonuclease-3